MIDSVFCLYTQAYVLRGGQSNTSNRKWLNAFSRVVSSATHVGNDLVVWKHAVIESRRPKLLIIWFLLTALFALLPVALFPMPPVLDFPNHVVRLWLIQGGFDISPLNHFYKEDWSGVSTNIGMDIVAWLTKGLLSPFLLARILLAFAVLLPPLGAAALNGSQFRGIEPWQFVFLSMSFALTLLLGFLNFEIGIGAALFAAAMERQRSPRSQVVQHAFHFISAAGLFVIHPFSPVFYAALLAGLTFGREIPDTSPKAAFAKVAYASATGAVAVVPGVLHFLLARSLPGVTEDSHTIEFNGTREALEALASPMFSYDIRVDVVFGLLFVLLIGLAIWKGAVRVHAGLMISAIAIAVIALFMPNRVGQTACLDLRLPIMALLAGLAAIRVSFVGPGRLALACAAVALVVLKTSWIIWNWSASGPMIASIRIAVASVPPGAVVLAMQHMPSNAELNSPPPGRILNQGFKGYNHYPTLVVPWQHAFIPILFSMRGKEPIRVLAPWDEVSDPEGGSLPSVHALWNPRLGPRYMRNWRSHFDYVLVLNADRPDKYGQFVPPPHLELVSNAGFAKLFRIKHESTSQDRLAP